MGLKGAGGDCHFDLAGWYFALELGHWYGWEPEGTTPQEEDVTEAGGYPEPFAWYGGYVDNAGRRVSAADARAWADALESALDDIPDHDARALKPQAYPMPAAVARLLRDMPGDGLPDPGQFVNALEWFSGTRKQELRDFVAYCRRGGFAVW
jgi:hypothetical protein